MTNPVPTNGYSYQDPALPRPAQPRTPVAHAKNETLLNSLPWSLLTTPSPARGWPDPSLLSLDLINSYSTSFHHVWGSRSVPAIQTWPTRSWFSPSHTTNFTAYLRGIQECGRASATRSFQVYIQYHFGGARFYSSLARNENCFPRKSTGRASFSFLARVNASISEWG